MTQEEFITNVLDTIEPVNEPGTFGDYLNFGYLVLGRIIEQVTEQNYEAYLQNGILNECQITRMHVGRDNQKFQNEVNYYPPAGYPISKLDSFGGWVATAIDLTRLLVRVDQIGTDDILNAGNLTLMYTPYSGNANFGPYAKGWLIFPTFRGHNGVLQGTRAFFAQTNNGGFSFAAIGNNNVIGGPDTFSFNLEAAMESICTGVSNWPSYDLYGVSVAVP